jgi:hypothetical protein
MGYFLNVICGDFDNIDNLHYLNRQKPSIEEKNNYLSGLFNFSRIRYSTINAVGENPNENYYYFFTHLGDLKYVDNDIPHNFLPTSDFLRGSYRHDSNLFIVYVGEEKNYEYFKIIFDKLGMPIDKLIMINESQINNQFIDKLIGQRNVNVLNIVYDKWDETNNEYFANLYPATKDYYRYRIQIGLFRFYNMFKEIRSCNVDEVWLNPNVNYFYFINGDNMHNHFREENTIPLPKKVRECFINCKNFNIILLNEHEFESDSFIIFIDKIVKSENLDSGRIYMLNNNSKLNEYSEKHNLNIQVYSLDFLIKFICCHMVELGEPKFLENKTGTFFLCHNRSPKSHRYALLTLLKHENIIDNVNWSLLMGWYSKNQREDYSLGGYFNKIFDIDQIKNYKSEIDFFNQYDIKKSNYEEDKTWFDDFGDNPNISWKDVYELKTYEESYFNIVTESCYLFNEIHITEKSIKPFYFYQFPLFLSSYNHIKYLKERFKFDMFDDVINHDYDNEPDHSKRLFMLIEEIKRINNNKDFFIEFYKNNKDRFIKNKNIVVGIHLSQNDQNYFRKLIHKKYE